MEESDHTGYRPIACDYVDLVEHYATLRKEIEIVYKNKVGEEVVQHDVVLTWENDGQAEYLITLQGTRIRLDHIVSLDGKRQIVNSCEK